MPTASRSDRIAEKLGGVVPVKKGGNVSIRPGTTLSTTLRAAGLRNMSISGVAVENGISRNGQSITGLAMAGIADMEASAATQPRNACLISTGRRSLSNIVRFPGTRPGKNHGQPEL
ncbi:hypothetical protein [uncultured Sphingobium sp.]|uniref:hypothetical protein n=1 Tax=uncultured Sphingobium sp. TaxID=316087 RepID=UPI00259B0F8E|nr:hypothetical protein [uncultured Sphingobium sp.]